MPIDRYVSEQPSMAVLDDLRARFTGYRVIPGQPLDRYMYQEGQVRAVEWIAAHRPAYFNTAFYEQARDAFRPREIKPGLSHDDIMLDAGRQSVLRYLKSRCVDKQVLSDPNKLRASLDALYANVGSLFSKLWG